MSSQINRLVQYVNKSLDGYKDKNAMDVICASVAVLYAIRKLSEERHYVSESNSDINYERIKSHFSSLASCYEHYMDELSDEQQYQLNNLIDDILDNEVDSDNMVSWIYQQLKSCLTKDALGKIGKDSNKLKGADMLMQTQFFTDYYMVKYLVDRVFGILENQLPNVVFVDPACGGGNFLTYIYSKLFEWYKKHTNYDASTINELILKDNIAGYDLDGTLSQIAGLSLYMCGRLRYCYPISADINVYGGETDDLKGFLTKTILSNTIGGKSFAELLSSFRKQNAPIVYITNPPFMGKRDMDVRMKDYLQAYYPNSKGDLCFSFMEQIMRIMRKQDLCVTVSQNGWMALSSLKNFRCNLLDNYFLHTCIDMGANAFESISGEKTNIVLSIITGKLYDPTKESVFVNLRGCKIDKKRELLASGKYTEYKIRTEKFRDNPNYEFIYQLGDDIDQFRSMHMYSEYSKCMQGSSTGDNKTMVKHIWETTESGWVLASKGGGYSKWCGLNLFKVKWGEHGELLKSNKGSALRNPNEMEKTAIVYSDTGTLGLSTRARLENQVFIASGPGIKVLKGNALCHLAFLNSKIATYFLKVLNPKFTVSAGYIGKIPVADGILDSSYLATLSSKCIRLKQEYLANKLPNYEFVHVDYKSILDVDSYVESCIRIDFFNQFRRYVYEQEIDKYILGKYELSDTQLSEYYKIMGGNMAYQGKMLNIRRIDKLIVSTLNDSCMSVSRKLNGFIIGTENQIDMISYMFSLPPKDVVRFIISNAEFLSETKKLYKRDLIHKLILKIAGVDSLSHVNYDGIPSIDTVIENLKKEYSYIYEQLHLSCDMIKDVIKDTHVKCFNNKPILKYELSPLI